MIFFPSAHSHPWHNIVWIFKILPSWLEWGSTVISGDIISLTSLFRGYFLFVKWVFTVIPGAGDRVCIPAVLWPARVTRCGVERQVGFAHLQGPWDLFSVYFPLKESVSLAPNIRSIMIWHIFLICRDGSIRNSQSNKTSPLSLTTGLYWKALFYENKDPI